jgi:hypothetical protein
MFAHDYTQLGCNLEDTYRLSVIPWEANSPVRNLLREGLIHAP